MMARFASEAERLRAHRAAFNLALELGITPREAEAELRKRRALASIEENRARLAAKLAPAAPAITAPASDEPWMMRD